MVFLVFPKTFGSKIQSWHYVNYHGGNKLLQDDDLEFFLVEVLGSAVCVVQVHQVFQMMSYPIGCG
jgi:hypothetical protein